MNESFKGNLSNLMNILIAICELWNAERGEGGMKKTIIHSACPEKFQNFFEIRSLNKSVDHYFYPLTIKIK